jgi:hypothetical protein
MVMCPQSGSMMWNERSYFPYEISKFLPGPTFPLSAQNSAPPAPSTSPPVSDIVVAEPNLKLPRTYGRNVALEQSLGNSQALSVTYVGALGREPAADHNLYNPNPDFQFVNVTSNTATSNYQALQMKFERRLSKGLQALASYTWSHSIDTASTDALGTDLNTPASIGNPNIDRGSSDFDIRHAFSSGITHTLPTP